MKCPECRTITEAKHNLNEAVKKVANELGNTPAVCRKAYIHPKLIKTYVDSLSADKLKQYTARQLNKYRQLPKHEATIMVFLERC
jgi:DNA topoisomerase-1